jgi:hypothetical protein
MWRTSPNYVMTSCLLDDGARRLRVVCPNHCVRLTFERPEASPCAEASRVASDRAGAIIGRDASFIADPWFERVGDHENLGVALAVGSGARTDDMVLTVASDAIRLR